MKRFIIYPGYVYGVDKKDRTKVGFLTLVRLYGLDPEECIDSSDLAVAEAAGIDVSKMFRLYPTFISNLEVPAEAKA